jgi:hypothetical protein
MKNNRTELKQLLDRLELVEDYSGFNGGDVDLSYAGDTEFGATGATQCVAPARTAMPYAITYTNSAGMAGSTFVVFGANRYADVTDFGCTAGTTITVGGGITYRELLAQSQTNPIKINRWRFIASATDLQQTLTATYRDANGSQYTQPLPLSIYSDMYAQSSTILDIDFPAKVDGTFYLTGTIAAASTSVVVIAFPETIIRPSNAVNNANQVTQYNAPILSAALGVAPSKQVGYPRISLMK